MIRYRAFRNTDPPALAELWCNHPPQRALVQPMTAELLEQTVFSKPYFDRHGLIVAEGEDRLVGFVHGGFGANQTGDDLSTRKGSVSLLMVGACEAPASVARELLRRIEQYLAERGAQEFLAGSVFPANPFYLGLYGSSQSPGVLQSDAETLALFRGAGYREMGRHAVLQRNLGGFRPVVDRQQMLLRREYNVEPEIDPAPKTWWEACTVGQAERVIYRLVSRRTRDVRGAVTFWDMERISGNWGVHAVGLMNLSIDVSRRREGLGTFLVGEALRHLHTTGISLAEVQIETPDAAASALFHKLSFQPVDTGYVLCKELEQRKLNASASEHSPQLRIGES
jgi:ribosomal protein S18 acetylase RimI-like enzyme